MMNGLQTWLIAINFCGFAAFAVDKFRAKQWKKRISEKTLFLCALLGGGVGCLAGMYLMRHKTKHLSFVIGIPLITLAEAVLLLLVFRY